ncbi:MAG TPA: ChbG/HpnK family deacetylase [Anaeromyxobacteraceae bacterium]|nr:ChbG/HpnK family deacetylase [Anaeromyxobacteraceae bacterium]
MRRLVVNADDLGYDPEIDRGILEAHARGIVTSATAMVDTPFAAEALRRAPASLGLGLHLVVDPASSSSGAEAEIRRQLRRFEELRGAPPTHLDGHKHAHRAPGVLEAVLRVAAPLRLPVRALDAEMRGRLRRAGIPAADRFLGDAAARPAWTEERLLAAVDALAEGVTEIMAHPGYRPAVARTSFGAEREVELAALLSVRVRAHLGAKGVRLCTYADLPGAGPA